MKKEKKQEFVVEFRETKTVMKLKVIKARSQAEANEIAETKYADEYDDGLGNAFESRIENVEPADKWPRNGRPWVKLVIAAVLAGVSLTMAQAEPRQSKERNHNYILRRQEAGLVSGVPTMRRIIGKREIDIYPNGLMFEKDNVVGVLPKR